MQFHCWENGKQRPEDPAQLKTNNKMMSSKFSETLSQGDEVKRDRGSATLLHLQPLKQTDSIIALPFLKKYFIIFILCALVLFLQTCLCEAIRSPGIGATESFELSCGCWEANLGPLKEHPVL